MEDGMKIVSGPLMLQSRQIVNWGSYGGYHVFRPSMDDAMPVTLTRRRERIGQIHARRRADLAAHPSGTPTIRRRIRDVRNATTHTYLRGMIGISDGENGETPIFLRGRTRTAPRRTSGARSSTHTRTAATEDCCPAQKFLYLTAGDGPDGLRRQYVTWNQTPSTRASWTGTATRHSREDWMEQTYPGCTTHVNAQAFHASIWQDMGLSAEACRLLHKIQSADAPSKLDDIFKQGVLDARIHPARPRNRRRLQPVQRELPQHGRQNGTRRHPAGHTSPLRRIRQTSQRTPRIHAHRPRPRARRDDARRMDMVAHGQRSTRRTAIGATQSQGIPGRHRPVSAAHRRTRHANRSRQRTHERHRRRQPAATRQGLRTRTPGRRRGAQTTARHRRTVRTRRRQTPRRRADMERQTRRARLVARHVRQAFGRRAIRNTSGWWWNVTPGRANATC